MLKSLLGFRFLTIPAIIGSVSGALLMFLIGSSETISAYKVFLGFKKVDNPIGDSNVVATVRLLSALDAFLLGMILLYFSFSIYFLFIRRKTEETNRSRIQIPDWLKVQSLGEMKKTLLEVIVVLLAVLFLKIGLTAEILNESPTLHWDLLLITIGIVAIATAIKLINFDRH